ncbi:MAG: hypothetical protein AAFR41_12255 [Pseudomonadota bacterium]
MPHPIVRLAGCAMLGLTAATTTPVADEATSDSGFTLADARSETVGSWTGELQYLDYQSGEWFGIPMASKVTVAPDGHAFVTTTRYDDGPTVGDVYIVSIAALDHESGTLSMAIFRKGRPMETRASALSLDPGAMTGAWSIVSTSDGSDDNRPAQVRETIALDDGVLTSLKEVDFTDDDAAEWLVRNRTVLRRSGDNAG